MGEGQGGLAVVSGEGGDFEIFLLFYLEIELAFQIINITMVSFEFLCFLSSNVYVTVFTN